MYHMYKKEGSVTVFLTILFLLFFALLGVTFENARVMSSHGYVRVAAHSAAMTAFGNYNRELYEEYGLFAYGGFNGMGIDKLEDEFTDILVENIKSMPENALKSFTDLYRLQNMECSITDINVLTESEVFHAQIEAFLKSSFAKDLTQDVLDKVSEKADQDTMQEKLTMTKDFEEGKYDLTEQNKDKENSSEEKTGTNEGDKMSSQEALVNDSAGGNPLEVFSDMARDGVLNLVCDTSDLSDSIIEPCEIDDAKKQQDQVSSNKENYTQKNTTVSNQEEIKAADFLANVLESQSGLTDVSQIKSGIEKTELICYANNQFNSYVKNLERTTKYGLEYIVAGNKEEKDNLSSIVNRLLAVRTMLNFAYVVTDAGLQNKSLTTATVLAGFTGLPPVINAVQYTILLILAFQEACIDVTALLDGRNVPLIKNATNFKIKYEEICLGTKSLFSSKAKSYKKTENSTLSTDISYEQYLWLFLLTNSKDTIQKRIFDLIQYDLRERYNQTFSIYDCICKSSYCIQYQIPCMFDNLPFLSMNDEWNLGVSSLEVKYGYKSE